MSLIAIAPCAAAGRPDHRLSRRFPTQGERGAAAYGKNRREALSHRCPTFPSVVGRLGISAAFGFRSRCGVGHDPPPEGPPDASRDWVQRVAELAGAFGPG